MSDKSGDKSELPFENHGSSLRGAEQSRGARAHYRTHPRRQHIVPSRLTMKKNLTLFTNLI
jgi:hypothetical protein